MNLISFIIINVINFSLIYLFNFYRLTISKKLNLVDLPDNQRKVHKYETPLIGGLIIVSICFINVILLAYTYEGYSNYSIIFFGFFGFLIGYFDDRKNINSYLRLFLFCLFLLTLLLLNENLIVKNISFDFRDLNIELKFLSIPFTILCILLLINAINLSDGINSLAILINIYFLLYINIHASEFDKLILLNLILSLFCIAYLNYKGNFFLGNSGAYFLGMLVSLYIISTYNLNLKNGFKINSEELFIVLFLPGIDMFRLFIERVWNKKNPFEGDKNHLHHFLIERFSLPKSLSIYLIIMISPYLIYRIVEIKPLFIILFFIAIYIFLIIFFRRGRYLK